MNMEIKEDEKGLAVEIFNEDYALAEIIHHELLEEKNVTFAGVVPPHPLIPKQVIRVRTQRIKPIKALQLSIEKALDQVKQIKDMFKATLGDKS